MSKPVLTGVNLVCPDIDATIDFYRLLDIDIPDASVWRTATGPHHVDLALPNGFGLGFDSPKLAAHYNAGSRDSTGRGQAIIGFSVASREDVDRYFARLSSHGYPELQVPYDAFWGARYAIVADPAGNPVGIMSPIDPSRRAPGPAL